MSNFERIQVKKLPACHTCMSLVLRKWAEVTKRCESVFYCTVCKVSSGIHLSIPRINGNLNSGRNNIASLISTVFSNLRAQY